MSKLRKSLPFIALVLVGCGSTSPAVPTESARTQAGVTTPMSQTAGLRLILTESNFRTQATAAEVSSIRLTVTPSSGSPVTKTVTKGAELAMNGLMPGKAALRVEALDAGNSVIGRVEKSEVELLAGQIISVQLTLKLQPTIVYAAGVSVNLDLIDGDIILVDPAATNSTAP